MNLISERLDVDDYDEAVELFYSGTGRTGSRSCCPRGGGWRR